VIPWIRIAIVAALLAAVGAAGLAVRTHWMDAGRAEVQGKWDAQKLVDAEAGRVLAVEARAEDNRQRINAERIADEQARQDQARAARIAALERSTVGLRDAIAKLDADDLSAAAADPRVAAVAARAVAARGLLGSCQARYASVAATANRVRDQAAGLLDFTLTVCRAGAAATPPELPKGATP
jgi:hypothetical protein